MIRPQKHICVIDLPRVDGTFSVTFHGGLCTAGATGSHVLGCLAGFLVAPRLAGHE